ncbi:MAG: MoaD/ThiS family protein [Candidatus Hydrothermarchaeaceae archaeon]
MKIENDTTVEKILEKLGINRETVVVSKNGEITIEEDTLKKGDEIEIIKIISGG